MGASKTLPSAVALSFLALLTLTACDGTPSAEAEGEPPVSAPRPVRLHTVSAEAGTQRHRFVARVDALQRVDLSFQVPGVLDDVPVRAGQTLAAGAVAARLQTTEYALAVRAAELSRTLAAQDLARKQQLLEREGISRALVDDAATLLALRDVELEQATEALADATLTAPFDAYVARRHVDPGGNVAAGTPILRILDLSELLLTASVREALLATVTPEQVVELHAEFDFLPGRRFPLTFFENLGEADAVAQTYELRFRMDAPIDANILPGMSATVTVELATPDGASARPTVPVTALVPDPDRPKAGGSFRVWRFDAERGVVEAAPVTIGPLGGSEVIVTSGLAVGDAIVVAGAHALRDGARVRPMAGP